MTNSRLQSAIHAVRLTNRLRKIKSAALGLPPAPEAVPTEAPTEAAGGMGD